ncbi:hypothetical protein I547_6138 [Mycobacterium kansasii 824]|nr:hypothetical protein I547_6138 [Mycobacterium kansasii 824]
MAPHGLDIRRELARRLGLAAPSISWHATRDRFVEVVAWAAQVAASLARSGSTSSWVPRPSSPS